MNVKPTVQDLLRRGCGLRCRVDLAKRDAEIKVLLGCSKDEMDRIAAVHNEELQAGLLIVRPTANA